MTSRCDTAHRASGFTLIETIVVIAVMGLMLVLVVANARPVSPAIHARAATQEIAAALRATRAEAVMGNRSTQFAIDLAQRNFRAGSAAPESYSNDLRLGLLTGRDELVADTFGLIRFYPDGSSSGGRVSIAGGGLTWLVGVDWLSGRVSIASQPE